MRETIPYAPGPTPQGGDLDQTQRFIETELRSISEALRLSVVQAAYGELQIFTPITLPVAGPTPLKISPWNAEQPAEPNRVEVKKSAATGTLTVQESGTYMAFFNLALQVTAGRKYQVFILINGTPTTITGVVPAVNNNPGAMLSYSGLVQMASGDVLTLYYSSDIAASVFNIEAATFGLFRVSELQKVM